MKLGFDIKTQFYRLTPAYRRAVFRAITLAGVAFLVGAGLQGGASLKATMNGEHYQGQVVELGKQKTRFVQFSRPDGETIVFKPDQPFFRHAGETVPVLLDPLRPGSPPMSAAPETLWLKAGLMGLTGVLLFGFGFPRMERRRLKD